MAFVTAVFQSYVETAFVWVGVISSRTYRRDMDNRAYETGGLTRLVFRLRAVAPLFLLATFTRFGVGWTAVSVLPQLAGVGGILHVGVDLRPITLQMTFLPVQGDGGEKFEGHSGSGWDAGVVVVLCAWVGCCSHVPPFMHYAPGSLKVPVHFIRATALENSQETAFTILRT